MTDQARTPTTKALAERLRLHAYDLVNGGTNANHLRNDLNEVASALLAAEQRAQALREALMKIADFGHADGCLSMAPVYECGCYGKSQAEIARAALAVSSEPPATGEQP